jgi:uncharacterized membrane protein YbaN (DUF454 family)
MLKIFSKETIEKHKEVFEKIIKENKNFADALKKYSKVGAGSYSKYMIIVALIILAGAWFYMRFYNKANRAQEEIVA